MKCIECKCCRKVTTTTHVSGVVQPVVVIRYVCYGTKEPFEITDLGQECTEYPENKNDDNWFLNEIKEKDDCFEILNWYRNLYHTEPDTTERGVVARAINELFAKIGKENHDV